MAIFGTPSLERRKYQPISVSTKPMKTKIGTEVAHVKRDWDTISRSKGQGHQAVLFIAVLAHQAAAAVDVGTCWPWETAATLPSARWRKALRRPRGAEGRGHIVAAARLQLVIIHVYPFLNDDGEF